MKSLYTGALRLVLQWIGKIKKKDVFEIIDEIQKVDAWEAATSADKATEIALFVSEKFVPSGKRWIVNILVEGIYAYARIKGILDKKK